MDNEADDDDISVQFVKSDDDDDEDKADADDISVQSIGPCQPEDPLGIHRKQGLICFPLFCCFGVSVRELFNTILSVQENCSIQYSVQENCTIILNTTIAFGGD